MSTFSINLPDETERQVQELFGTNNYAYKREVFIEAIELLYLKTFSESDVVTYENYADSTTPDTSVPTTSGGLKVTITIKDCEQDKNPPSVSAYDRLASVLGIHNGSYLS